MGLTGTPFLVLSAVATVAFPILAIWLWNRAPGPRLVKALQRLGLVLTCQLSAVLMAGVVINDDLALYDSWSDLLGTGTVTGTIQPDSAAGSTGGSSSGPGGTGTPAAELPGTGRVRVETVTGATSEVTARVWVLLPKDYSAPAELGHHYPVVEFLPGFPGTPTTWLHALKLEEVMDAEVAAGRVKPFIAVLPTMNVASPRDTECVDVQAGPKVATWLAVDVPRLIAAQTRALPFGAAWATAGYSTGGFCAVKLTMTYPTTFAGAAVISGYFSPSSAAGLNDLFGGNLTLRHDNDPMWLLAHRIAPAVSVLVVASDQDPSALQPTKAFLGAVRAPMTADKLIVRAGGHNTGVWLDLEPQVLQWLSHHLQH